MSLYTLFIATVINVNKELPVQSGMSLAQCSAAATQALLNGSNYARCRPSQPEKPVVYLKLPTGAIVKIERAQGGYRLPAGYSSEDEAFAIKVLGRPSSGVHTGVHGPDRTAAHAAIQGVVVQ